MFVTLRRVNPELLVGTRADGSTYSFRGVKSYVDCCEKEQRAQLVKNTSSKLVRNQPPAEEDAPLAIPVMNFDPIQHTNPIAGLPDTDEPSPSYFGAAGAPVGNEDDQPLVPPVMNFDAPTQRPLGGVHNETVRNRGTGGQSTVNSSHGDDSEALPLPPTTF